MSIKAEIDFLLTLDPSGVRVLEGDDSNLEQLREWLSTPEGTVYGRPGWGHPLNQYRHEPPNANTARAIENSLLLKLVNDMPELAISRILCEPAGKDMYYIGIVTPRGVIEINEQRI